MLRRLQYETRYFFRPPWDTGVSPPELHSYISSHPPGRALDLGCGTGTNIITLARAGWDVTGIDFSRRAITIARKKLQMADVQAKLLEADVARPLGFTNQFDLALDLGCFHSVSDRRGYLVNLAALLRPGGHWLVYGFLRLAPGRIGIGRDDLETVSFRGLRLLERTDGKARNDRPSAWFLFEHD